MVSNLWCRSSTSVASGPSAAKRTSTSDFIAASGCHCALTCQTMTIRCGGSHSVMVATLADLAEKVLQAGFKAPTITIVGEVVKLREKLSWFEPE